LDDFELLCVKRRAREAATGRLALGIDGDQPQKRRKYPISVAAAREVLRDEIGATTQRPVHPADDFVVGVGDAFWIVVCASVIELA
jgi:hypothetical protein